MTIGSDDFLSLLREHDIRLASGVPCSILEPIMTAIDLSPSIDYIPAANEGNALAIVAGAMLGGDNGVALMQDSGFGNVVNPLTSLCLTYGLSPFIVVGYHDPVSDEPQHREMATLFPDILRSLGLPLVEIGRDTTDVAALGRDLDAARASGRPVVIGIRRRAIAARGKPDAAGGDKGTRLERDAAMAVLLSLLPPEAAVIVSTGHLSRSAHALGADRPAFYMVGSMGHASSIALGLSRTGKAPERIVVVDGDGAMLMHLGALSTIGAAAPASLVHVVFDNGSYDSTGGQASTSATTDLAAVAMACGYRRANTSLTRRGLARAVEESLAIPGPHLLVVKTHPSPADELPSVMARHAPPAIAARFAAQVRGAS